MNNTVIEIYQQLKKEVDLLYNEYKNTEYKHRTTVMSCGHGQYPKHLETRRTAEVYELAALQYSAHKKILDIMESHKKIDGKFSNEGKLLKEIDELIDESIKSGRSDFGSIVKKWRAEFQVK